MLPKRLVYITNDTDTFTMGSLTSAGIGASIVVLIILAISAPLIIYHVLIFPNVEGFFGDLNFYSPDESSTHFLYWFFFWNIAFGSGIVVVSKVNAKA